MSSNRNTRRTLSEHIAEHHYHEVPRRASALAAPDTDEVEEVTFSPPRTTAASRISKLRQAAPAARAAQAHEEEGDDDIYERRLPSSVRRYHPNARAGQPVRGSATTRRGPSSPFLTRGLVVLSIVATIFGTLTIPPLWREVSDTLTYGFPRTYQLDANVGHGSAKAPLSHFIGINNHGVIEVLEIPTSLPTDPGALHLYVIAQLGGPHADQEPVTITFEDVNGDGKPDMIVHCSGNEYILYNTGHAFQKP